MGDDNWLADALGKHGMQRKWAYITSALGCCLIVGAAVIFLSSNKPVAVQLKNAATTSQNGSTSLTEPSQSGTPLISTSSTQSTSSAVSSPSAPSVTAAPTPAVSVPVPTLPKASCSATDSEYVTLYNNGASSLFVNLSDSETKLIDTYYNDGGIVPVASVLSAINNDIASTNSASQNDYNQYVTTDQQAGCTPTLAASYQVPACDDISVCVYQIPSAP